jgi:hypothetical protein
MINFSNKSEESKSSLLKPGYRVLKMGKIDEMGDYIPPFSSGISKSGKPYILVTLRNPKTDFIFRDNMFLTENTLFRVEYLHKKMFKSPIPENFSDEISLSDYLNTKYIENYDKDSLHNFVISGEYREDVLELRIAFKEFYNPPAFKERDFTEREEKIYIK